MNKNVIYIFHKILVEKKTLEIFSALLSNVVGDKKLRSYLAFKGFGKENQREVVKADNATTHRPPRQENINVSRNIF